MEDQRGLAPDRYSYAAVMVAFRRARRPDAVADLLREARDDTL